MGFHKIAKPRSVKNIRGNLKRWKAKGKKRTIIIYRWARHNGCKTVTEIRKIQPGGKILKLHGKWPMIIFFLETAGVDTLKVGDNSEITTGIERNMQMINVVPKCSGLIY